MDNAWIQFHLVESKEELDKMIKELEELDEEEFVSRMRHLYHHLNTAFNSRNLDGNFCFDASEKDDVFFSEQRKFPEIIV